MQLTGAQALIKSLEREGVDTIFGLPGGAEQAAGDLLATLRIVLPNELDADLTALMQKMRDQKPYQPRSGMS